MAKKIKQKKANNLIFYFLISSIAILCSSCSRCSRESAVIEFKEYAWHGLLDSDTIWFPYENEMNIVDLGAVTGEYKCDFITYGKVAGQYRAYKVQVGIKCTPQGWIGSDYAANLANSYGWEVTDSELIKKLEQTPPSQFTHKKKSWEKD